MNLLIAKYLKERGIEDKEKSYEAIQTFFLYFKESMKSDTLPEIRLKGLGSFQIAISRMKEALLILENQNKKGTITQEYYQERKNQLLIYLKANAKYENFD